MEKKETMPEVICENDTYIFYMSDGTHTDAVEVAKRLRGMGKKNPVVDLDRRYGWYIRVKKD